MYRAGTVGILPAAEIYVNVGTPHLIASRAARIATINQFPEQHKSGELYHHHDSIYYRSEDSRDRVSTDSPTAPAASTPTSSPDQVSPRASCNCPPTTSQYSILWHSHHASAASSLLDGGHRRLRIAGRGAGPWGWSGRWRSRDIGVAGLRGRFLCLEMSLWRLDGGIGTEEAGAAKDDYSRWRHGMMPSKKFPPRDRRRSVCKLQLRLERPSKSNISLSNEHFIYSVHILFSCFYSFVRQLWLRFRDRVDGLHPG
jgi:hypothetical protein